MLKRGFVLVSDERLSSPDGQRSEARRSDWRTSSQSGSQGDRPNQVCVRKRATDGFGCHFLFYFIYFLDSTRNGG